MVITSPANERLKHARRVREGQEPALIFIEGERLVAECLQAKLALHACFHLPEPGERAAALLHEIACPQFAVSEAAMTTLSDTVTPQGLVVLAERPRAVLADLLAQAGLIVVLDAVQDPGNAGTILRTAEAANATGVIALKGTTDLFAPKTLRSAMGSAFRLPIVSDVSGSEWLAKCDARGWRTVAATMDAELDYDKYDWRQPALLFLGNEGNGVTSALLERVNSSVRIPLHPPVESLNVAAAAAVILFEAARQRRLS
jgi:TrmH family RNA methyltransferase